jgi:hypothetical protein
MKKVLFAAMVAAALSPLSAQTQPPAKIDISNLPAQARAIDNVIVPVPSEIFGVLDKLGHPRWNEVLRPTKENTTKPSGEQPQIALQLGTVIAEGFIAVEAQDATEVKRIGASVRKLAKAIAVEKAVIDRAKAITDNADKKDWVAVRKELDGALKDVKKAMSELENDALAHLVSIGGWLRGTEALTQVVGGNFTQDGAELLHQPVLLDYFDKQLKQMPKKFRSNPVVTDVESGVKDIRPRIGIENGDQISEKSVKEVGDIAGRLIKTINSK